MARASFIMDRIMRKFGLNGRSVIPIIGATACAVPSIMSTRSISNFKERLITIFVLPLMSCSARLPVYTLLISMTFPNKIVFGFLNLKGLVLLSLYLLGFAFTLITAFALKKILKTKEASFYLMEMPVYRWPLMENVLLTVYNKVKVFVIDAGKIILAISIILWFLSNYGPGDNMEKIEKRYSEAEYGHTGKADPNYYRTFIASKKLEASYIGHLGKAIEPAIKPLGYDWKIGIALLTSFAAREVFVGTMATIYGASNEDGIQETLMKERDERGNLKYTLPVCFSLVIFYVFAMQCMSTLAVVRRETKTWKWPILQFVYLTTLAYVSALVVFNVLS
jgi:ferrous iron transport protein B